METAPRNLAVSCRPTPIEHGSRDGLAEIVRAYLEHKAPNEERCFRFYQNQRSLPAAIEKAAMAELPSGKRFSHQRRIPRAVLVQTKNALLNVQPGIRACRTFDELFHLTEKTVGPIRGIGELAVYDTAHRLGAYLNLRPEFVYLHAGVRTGIGALGLGLNERAHKLSMADLPAAFQVLKPEQAEDCLCIFKGALLKITRS